MDNGGFRREKQVENRDNGVIHIWIESIQRPYPKPKQFLNTSDANPPALFFPGEGYALVHQNRWITAVYMVGEREERGLKLWMDRISDNPIVDCDFLSPISHL